MHSLVRSLLYFRLKVKHYDFNFFRLCGVNNSWASFEGIPIIILLTKLRGFESLEEGNPAALKWTALKIYITKSFKFYLDLVNNSVDDNLEETFFTACSGRSEISVIQFGRHNNTFPSLISRIDSVYEAEPSLPPCAVTASFSFPFFFFFYLFWIWTSRADQLHMSGCSSVCLHNFEPFSFWNVALRGLTAPFQEVKVS